MLIRKTLEFAGPAFIKWGQWASTRYDVFPAVLCHELEKLQSTAPEHKWEHTKSTLERVYGDTFDHIFESFENTRWHLDQLRKYTGLRFARASLNRRRNDRIYSRDLNKLIAGVEILLFKVLMPSWTAYATCGTMVLLEWVISYTWTKSCTTKKTEQTLVKGRRVVTKRRRKENDEKWRWKLDIRALLTRWSATFNYSVVRIIHEEHFLARTFATRNTVGQFGVHMLSQVDLGRGWKFEPVSKILPVDASGILSYSHNVLIRGRCAGGNVWIWDNDKFVFSITRSSREDRFRVLEQNKTLAALGVNFIENAHRRQLYTQICIRGIF